MTNDLDVHDVARHIGPIILMPEGQNRAEFDFYPTPLALAEAAIRLLPKAFNPIYVLDPGAGSGVWGRAARRVYGSRPLSMDGIEIREDARITPDYDLWHRGDFLKTDIPNGYTLIAGNPPYAQAEAFIRRSMNLLVLGGYLVQLLRLAFLETQERGYGLWLELPPKEVYVCVERPSFYPKGHPKAGNTDATAYAIYIWQKGWAGKTELKWLSWR